MNKNTIIGVVVGIVIVVFLGLAFWWGNTTNLIAPEQTATSTIPTPTPSPSITPQAGAPTVKTNTNVEVSSSAAAVSGQVTPNGAQTTYWYEYGKTTALGTKTNSQTVGSGFNSIGTPGYIVGLNANTSYYFRLSSKNSFGTVNGETFTFKTNNNPSPQGVAPTVRTASASSVSRTTVNLNGSVNPNGHETTYWFEYGEDTTLGNVTAFQSAGAGTNSSNVAVSISGLKPLTKYYFRLNAQNQYGTVNGAIQNLTTSGPIAPSSPSIKTTNATDIGATSVTMTGQINPNGAKTTYWFEYNDNSLVGGVVAVKTESQSLDAGTAMVSVKINVDNLRGNTRYDYRLVAQNDFGTIRGDTLSFQTR